MTLQAQGFRFVQRGQQWLWVWRGLMLPGDIDCTDMGEDEFERAVMAAQINTPK